MQILRTCLRVVRITEWCWNTGLPVVVVAVVAVTVDDDDDDDVDAANVDVPCSSNVIAINVADAGFDGGPLLVTVIPAHKNTRCFI